MISRQSAKQLLHYGIFGISRNFVGYMVYLLITYLGIPPKIAMTCLYGVGAIVGFFGNRKFIFAHKGSVTNAGVRYLVAHFLGYLINLVILILMVDKLGYAHQWVQIVAIFIVAGFLFLSFKFFVFLEVDLIKNKEVE